MKLTCDDHRPNPADNTPAVKDVLYKMCKSKLSCFNLFWDAISTFGVGSKAALTTGEYSKLVLTARGGDGSRVCWSVAAV